VRQKTIVSLVLLVGGGACITVCCIMNSETPLMERHQE